MFQNFAALAVNSNIVVPQEYVLVCRFVDLYHPDAKVSKAKDLKRGIGNESNSQ